MERCEVAGINGRMIFEDIGARLPLSLETYLEVYTNPVFDSYKGFDDTFHSRIWTLSPGLGRATSPRIYDGSGIEGAEAQRVIHAAIRSLDNGGIPVKVSEVFD